MIFNCLRIWMWKSTIGLWVSQCEKTAELSNIWCPLSLRHMTNPKLTSGDTSINNLYHGNVFQNYNTTQGFVALQILHQYKYVMYVYIYIYVCMHIYCIKLRIIKALNTERFGGLALATSLSQIVCSKSDAVVLWHEIKFQSTLQRKWYNAYNTKFRVPP